MKTVIDLNGIWKFAPTHDQKPNNNHNVLPSSMPLYCHPDLCRDHWQDVPVPGVWQHYAEKYSVYEGVCWFYREFDLREVPPDGFARLVLKGVNYRADVYVNARFVGTHESAYTEFSFDITEYLQPGKNALTIQVDNRPTEVKWPNDWGYGVYGGIHRDVFLELFTGERICPCFSPSSAGTAFPATGMTSAPCGVKITMPVLWRNISPHGGSMTACPAASSLPSPTIRILPNP